MRKKNNITLTINSFKTIKINAEKIRGGRGDFKGKYIRFDAEN